VNDDILNAIDEEIAALRQARAIRDPLTCSGLLGSKFSRNKLYAQEGRRYHHRDPPERARTNLPASRICSTRAATSPLPPSSPTWPRATSTTSSPPAADPEATAQRPTPTPHSPPWARPRLRQRHTERAGSERLAPGKPKLFPTDRARPQDAPPTDALDGAFGLTRFRLR